VKVVLSIVHGDPDEELDVLQREATRSPNLLELYLGDGKLDLRELSWLHERRRREASYADRLLVPSEHIADRLACRGVSRDRITVVPYAADLERFRPIAKHHQDKLCHFVFAGGLTQRKGIGYLLEAWLRVYRPGWKLTLLGALPRRLGPLRRQLEQPGVRVAGSVAYSEMPARLGAADVFVFPSLFEGSAVVTYEALACGLPSIVTPQAGSVVRDGVEGIIVPPANVDALAEAMEQLGTDAALRAHLARAARRRAEAFDWMRYGTKVCEVIRSTIDA
jgi:glycosyltransferase involved in cell wall biosynthesis